MDKYERILNSIGKKSLYAIKKANWFPYKTGNLKFHATSGQMISSNTYQIHFDSNIAPYVEYLEEGTRPHDIPHAFGKALPFGIGGRFDGKFHPGSYKHQYFIKNKSVEVVKRVVLSKKGARLV